jgi:replication factor C subunit 2/4
METYSRVTRFCIICNYVSRIIEPLASRCAKFRFKPLTFDGIENRLKFVAEKENVVVTDVIVKEIAKVRYSPFNSPREFFNINFLVG